MLCLSLGWWNMDVTFWLMLCAAGLQLYVWKAPRKMSAVGNCVILYSLHSLLTLVYACAATMQIPGHHNHDHNIKTTQQQSQYHHQGTGITWKKWPVYVVCSGMSPRSKSLHIFEVPDGIITLANKVQFCPMFVLKQSLKSQKMPFSLSEVILSFSSNVLFWMCSYKRTFYGECLFNGNDWKVYTIVRNRG